MSERERGAGRRRYRSRREAEQVAADFQASGLTLRQFRERDPVSQSALARYVQRHREPSTETLAPAAEARPRWMAVEVAAPAPEPGASGLWVCAKRLEKGRFH